MQTPLNRKRLPLMAWLGVAVSAVLLTACGGGGGGNSSSSGGVSGGSSSGSLSGPVSLSGVVATSAPLIGATVTVLDAGGNACGTASTALADGTYSLTLTCSSPTLPFVIEAVGVDMSGAPVVLHSLAQAVASGSGTLNSVHVNPLTNAVVALLMGGDPTPYFNDGKASATGSAAVRSAKWSLLGSSAARNVASDFLKTVIKNNLDDAKLTNATLVDFFTDTSSVSFSPNKTGLDAALEGLRIQFSKVNVTVNNQQQTHPVLQLSNRLLPPCNPNSSCNASTNLGSPEVMVDLTTASGGSGLNAATPAIPSGATISSSKKTTSTSAIMASIYSLESMRSTINANLNLTNTAADILALTYKPKAGDTNKDVFVAPSTPSTFGLLDGMDSNAVASLLVGYGASGYQLSSFMVVGCLDYPIVARCTKTRIAALLRDGVGNIQATFDGVANYINSTSSWALVGNGRQTSWAIYPVSWLYLNGDGSELATSATGPNPGQGIQTIIRSLDPLVPLFADVTASSGTVHFFNCNSAVGDPMCLTRVGGVVWETGDLVLDQVLPTTNTSWLGPTDTRPGSHFQMSATGLGLSETTDLILGADLPPTSNRTAYPKLDGLSVNAPLLRTDLEAGLTISWATWAAANPGLRMVEVRAVITRPSTRAPTKQVFTINPLAGTQLTIPAFSSVPSDAVEDSLWLIAQDGLGRRYITKIATLP